MKSKPKILFVYDHKKPEYWMDGLWAALNVLQEDFEIEKQNLAFPEIKPHEWDLLLGWGAFESRVDIEIRSRTGKKGLCIAGNAVKPHSGYDILFYETKWVRDYLDLKTYCDNLVHAFGVNTDIFFKHDITMPIMFDYIGVGALANWKRWEKMIERPGTKLVVGEYQEDNEQESLMIARNLLKGGVMVSNMVSPYDLANLYHWSRAIYLPADINGGGERAILEAKACGLQMFIQEDNPKLHELSNLDPVPTHHDYAKKLKDGILSVL